MQLKYLDSLLNRYKQLNSCKDSIEKAYTILTSSFKNGNKLLVCGNGGSASDSDHITGELLKSFVKKRILEESFTASLVKIDKEVGSYLSSKLQGALPVIALSNNTSLITATLNDIDSNLIFAQQVMGLGKENDVFLGISTSGNSKDIIYAMTVAKAKGLKTIALTGNDGGKLKNIADVSIIAPETETYKIQELHLPIYHTICLLLEEYFWKE